MQTPEFRRILRQEASQWEQDGLIDRNLHAQLADRYQFDKLEDEASSSFVTILTGLGCVLIGMGVLSFVAANWQYLDKPWRSWRVINGLVDRGNDRGLFFRDAFSGHLYPNFDGSGLLEFGFPQQLKVC
jgi:Predicted membrane protein (DUF2157)